MIVISKLTADIDGSVVIEEKADSEDPIFKARVSKTQTLDGGVYVDHQGFAFGDTPLEISARLTEAEEAKLWNIFRNETFVHISTKYGFFLGAISSLKANKGNIQIIIQLKETV